VRVQSKLEGDFVDGRFGMHLMTKAGAEAQSKDSEKPAIQSSEPATERLEYTSLLGGKSVKNFGLRVDNQRLNSKKRHVSR
jgi:hypothetical protein